MNAPLRQKTEIELAELAIVSSEVQRLMNKYLTTMDADYLGSVAMNLQSFYTGSERILLAIAKVIDQSIPTGEHWHQALLDQLATDIDVIRPRLLSEELRQNLDELRRFRHVVRGLYAFKLDPQLIQSLAFVIPQVFERLQVDCQQFWERMEE
jgi:hypothetical protein